MVEKIYIQLKIEFEAEIVSIENLQTEFNINIYAGLVIDFPVTHIQPTKQILKFAISIESFEKKIPVYIFTNIVYTQEMF